MNAHISNSNYVLQASGLPTLDRLNSQKKALSARHLWLITRILATFVTVGLLGYTVDRIKHSLQH
jgi:hypothetical protein